MKDVTDKNFGPLIAFCLPGFILLLALSFSIPTVKEWLATSAAKDGPSIGGFLYATLASLSLGLLLSGLRWATVDQFLAREHWITGKPLPIIEFSELDDKEKLAAFLGVIENHYRYYQYYSNSLVAVELGGISYLWNVGNATGTQWMLAVVLMGILFAASRDCFRKYRIRGAAVTARRAGNDERLGAQKDGQGCEPSEAGEKGKDSEESDEEDGEESEESSEEEVKADGTSVRAVRIDLP